MLISPTLFTASPTDLIELFLLSGVFYLKLLPEIYHSTASATDLRDIFLPSVVFYLIPLPDIWLSLVLSRLPWEPAILHSRLQDLSLRFSHRPICLFESLSVQQKVINPPFNSYMYRSAHIIFILPQTFFIITKCI